VTDINTLSPNTDITRKVFRPPHPLKLIRDKKLVCDSETFNLDIGDGSVMSWSALGWFLPS
jgi:hypothetical protein